MTEENGTDPARVAGDHEARNPQPSSPAIDWRVVLETVDGDQDFLKTILAAANQEITEIGPRLESAAAAEDAATARRLAHTIKGAARTFGASRLMEVSASVEESARQGDFPAVHHALPKLQAAMREFLEELQAYQAKQ